MAIQVGLIGFGLGGSVFHAPLIRTTPPLRLKSVVTSQVEKVRQVAGVQAVARVEDLLADPEINLVVVATPAALHFEHARAALEAGKHVVVDKPFTVTAPEAGILIALAKERQRTLSVYQNRRWDGDYLAVKRCIEDGVLGTVYHFEAHYDRFRVEVRARWKEQPGPGSGMLYDLGSHVVDQALHLFGMPEAVTADVMPQRPGSETADYFHLILHYGRMRVILHGSMLVPRPGPHFVVHGDGGSLFTHGMDWQEEALKSGRLPGDPNWGLGEAGPNGEVFTPDGHRSGLEIPPGTYQAFYAGIVETLEHGVPPPVDPEDARKGLLVIEAALRSAEEERTVGLG